MWADLCCRQNVIKKYCHSLKETETTAKHCTDLSSKSCRAAYVMIQRHRLHVDPRISSNPPSTSTTCHNLLYEQEIIHQETCTLLTGHWFMLLGEFIKCLFRHIIIIIIIFSLAFLSGMVVWTVKQQESVNVIRLENHLHHNIFFLCFVLLTLRPQTFQQHTLG